MASRSEGKSRASRPKTSQSVRSSFHQQYRLSDNQTLNTIHSEINKVFKQENVNKPYQEVRGLTLKYAAGYTKRIERMCVQFGIRSNSAQLNTVQSQKLNVQGIAKRFIRARSIDKLKENERTKMKQVIFTITERNQEIKQTKEDFFKINRQSLKRMEIKAYKKRSNLGKKDHPFMTIYQNSQKQALAALVEKNRLSLQQVSNHPTLIEMEDWQKQSKQIRKIYTDVKTFRFNTLRSVSKYGSKMLQGNLSSIFLT